VLVVIQAEEVAEASERQAVGGVEHQGVVAYPVKVVVVKAESVEICPFFDVAFTHLYSTGCYSTLEPYHN
tara:strand:+ start:212 stop:421 length:210 start_codon:yes stop_codon:yes gene_type:complete